MAKLTRERPSSEPRAFSFETQFTRYAEGSVLVKAGATHVLCTASIEESVPNWLAGKGQGWITAEYSMLPRATHTRTKRDREKVSGRTQEIQRLIGRAARAMLDLRGLGERTLMLDCDVLQADGGTRTTSITGACVAVALALKKIQDAGKLGPKLPMQESIAAISVGLKDGQALVDLDYEEDSTCEVDMNFVITGSGKLVEVQGTAEHGSFTVEQMQTMTTAALCACKRIREFQRAALAPFGIELPI